ncbi:leucyl aminopeptidase [Litorimonas taeanensis]|uniref:Leucyl aminopeptidase n=1 Tax=Litorimonas taeanensis TaxID=568099 RepID=A0A420WMC8_9PROT|nr:leucyl aminopeptidase family protein [Litorimonas taeanensis]RKQ72062.1 leucyl aminopeptidase [Litorimonas taeanensis]
MSDALQSNGTQDDAVLVLKTELSDIEIASITPIYAVRPKDWEILKSQFDEVALNFAKARNFTGEAGQRVRLPNAQGQIAAVLYGAGPQEDDAMGPIRMGGLSSVLPQGFYQLAYIPKDWTMNLALTAWGLGAYRFETYLKETTQFPTLVVEDGTKLKEVLSLAGATALCRDLINTPAGDMGPVALQQSAMDLAAEFGAELTTTIGDELLEKNYPMIHAVGRAAHEAPRLVEFEWGDPSHPRLAVVGKGITFDTGGLNIKGASGARLMKKDMGGAAHALALAKLVMENDLPIRLHCLIAVAENAISAGAYRPGDILSSRAGLTIEIDNTDAEGRLVLGDALCKATESDPALIIDFATLTGAARVALGPQVPPFFCNREKPVADILAQGEKQIDPLWRMPLWAPYYSMLSSPIADMKNSGGSFAGCVTAALFLQRFVKNTPWMHLDTYGWNPSSRPAHPKGGDMYGVRALYFWLKAGGLNGDLSK